MKTIHYGAIGATLAVIATFALTADARSPICFSASGASGYASGFNLERNLLQSIWWNNYSGDCSNLESFVSAIDIPFAGTPTSSPSLLCRDEGIGEAVQSVIATVTQQCVQQCSRSGQSIGQLEGLIYCHVNLLSSQPVPTLCSLVAQQTCFASFDSTVAGLCSAKRDADPAGYSSFRGLACAL